MIKNNKSGMTLVEIVIAMAILAICGVALVSSFTTSFRILNRATMYKNESAASSEAIELSTTDSIQSSSNTITFKISGISEEQTVKGDLIKNVTSVTSQETGLVYTEFISGFDQDSFSGLSEEELDALENQ